MKLTDIVVLAEARDPELKYTEKKVKDKIDRVIVTLEGNQSGKFTKLAKRYKILQRALAVLTEKQGELNTQIKDQALEFFNAEDEVLTRVVETVSLTITVSKKTAVTSTKIDYDAVIAQLTEMVPELKTKIDELIAANTEIKKTEKSPSLRTELKEGVAEWIRQVKQITKNLFKSMKLWGKSYDKKLALLNKQLGTA
ncbi:MAG: hypothetical protein QXN55_01425 [Candidatus Nitrosotenuis sp.]